MDFARKQMEKYGWREGEGLGKNKCGISKPIKPKLKFNTAGLGHDEFQDIHDSWWERVYDEAAKNLCTDKTTEKPVTEDTDSIAVNINKKKLGIKEKKGMYSGFVKTSELRNNRENKIIKETKKKHKHKKKKIKDKSDVSTLTEEELFQICGGRTIHKAARHGLNLNGKLARLQQQEYNLLQNM